MTSGTGPYGTYLRRRGGRQSHQAQHGTHLTDSSLMDRPHGNKQRVEMHGGSVCLWCLKICMAAQAGAHLYAL
jgi:hypothetical protein